MPVIKSKDFRGSNPGFTTFLHALGQSNELFQPSDFFVYGIWIHGS